MGGKKDGFGCGGGCGGLRIGGVAGGGGFVIDFSKCFFMSKRRRERRERAYKTLAMIFDSFPMLQLTCKNPEGCSCL